MNESITPEVPNETVVESGAIELPSPYLLKADADSLHEQILALKERVAKLEEVATLKAAAP